MPFFGWFHFATSHLQWLYIFIWWWWWWWHAWILIVNFDTITGKYSLFANGPINFNANLFFSLSLQKKKKTFVLRRFATFRWLICQDQTLIRCSLTWLSTDQRMTMNIISTNTMTMKTTKYPDLEIIVSINARLN